MGAKLSACYRCEWTGGHRWATLIPPQRQTVMGVHHKQYRAQRRLSYYMIAWMQGDGVQKGRKLLPVSHGRSIQAGKLEGAGMKAKTLLSICGPHRDLGSTRILSACAAC